MDNPIIWVALALVLVLGVDGYLLYLKRREFTRQYNARLRRLAEMLNQAERDRKEGGRK